MANARWFLGGLLLIISFEKIVFCMEEKFEKRKENIRLLLTTALVKKDAEAREREYRRSFMRFRELGYKNPLVVEGVQASAPSFFEEYTDAADVYYYPNGRSSDKNRGKFEGLSMAAGLEKFGLSEESYIYKQTGRYFATRDLAEVVKEHPGFDAYLKRDGHHGIVLLVGYLWRGGKLLEMLRSLDYGAMEREYDPKNPKPAMIETHVTDYVKKAEQEKKLDVKWIEGLLGILVNPANSSTGLLSSDQVKY